MEDLITREQGVSQDGTPYDDFDFNPLIELVQRVVRPATWDVEGGPSTLKEFANRKLLVCTQTRVAHEEIERLLEVLRRTSNPAQSISDAHIAANETEGSSDSEAEELDIEHLLSPRSRPQKIDANPEPWRVPQRYDE